jgi:aspartokinase
MTTHDPAIAKTPYPGRTELDTANRQFRKAVARLHREALRTNKDLVPVVAAIVQDATDLLTVLARQAEGVTIEEPTRRKLRKAVRGGSTRAAMLLVKMDTALMERVAGRDDS